MMESKSFKIILSIIVILLLIPFIAMQFTDEVSWSIIDFIVMGALLLGTGLLCELIIRKVKHKIVFCIIILFVFLMVWAELAVGFLESLFSGI